MSKAVLLLGYGSASGGGYAMAEYANQRFMGVEFDAAPALGDVRFGCYDVVVLDADSVGGLTGNFNRVHDVYKDIVKYQPDAEIFVRSVHGEERLNLNAIKDYIHLGSFERDGRDGDRVINTVASFLQLEKAA